MTRTSIISRIAEDVRKQIERRINDYSDRDLLRYPPETGNYESEQTAIDYCLDICGGVITDGTVYDKNGWPCVRLTEYLNENFPDLSADINRMLEEAGVDWLPYDCDRLED